MVHRSNSGSDTAFFIRSLQHLALRYYQHHGTVLGTPSQS